MFDISRERIGVSYLTRIESFCVSSNVGNVTKDTRNKSYTKWDIFIFFLYVRLFVRLVVNIFLNRLLFIFSVCSIVFFVSVLYSCICYFILSYDRSPSLVSIDRCEILFDVLLELIFLNILVKCQFCFTCWLFDSQLFSFLRQVVFVALRCVFERVRSGNV